jgi:predicted PolB exonuclease-like 3'-5' exonuclease
MVDDARPPSFLIFDTESVPDGRLLNLVQYRDGGLTDVEAVQRAQQDARERSATGSDFLPVAFQYPVAICVIRVKHDFRLERITCLDAPQFRPAEIVGKFWEGLGRCLKQNPRLKLVTFNGRTFDLPLLELAAFRYGYSATAYYQCSRNRYGGNHLDLMDWLTNYGASRLTGGLNLLSKMLGKPGKMAVSGDQVHALHAAGKKREINDYCMFDTLDTYFVFLRTRVMTGELPLEEEKLLVQESKQWLISKVGETPALRQYLGNWGDWEAWP